MENLTREQRLDAALRHARGIVASEITDLQAKADDGRIRDHRHLPQARRLWAQIEERERWIAAWDAALAPAEALELVAPGTPDPRD